MKKLAIALVIALISLAGGGCSSVASRARYQAAYCYETRESIKRLALEGKYDVADALIADYKRECAEAE